MMENIKPMDIEKRSFAIITELLGDTKLEEENELVIKRVIHTTADFDYVQNLVFSPHAVTKGLDALRAGCHIVTDTQMAKAGHQQNDPRPSRRRGALLHVRCGRRRRGKGARRHARDRLHGEGGAAAGEALHFRHRQRAHGAHRAARR